MKNGSDAGRSPVGRTRFRPRVRNWHLFVVLACGTLAVTYFTNRVVMTEEVYGALVAEAGGSASEVEQLVAGARRWETAGTLLIPLLLFIRVGVAALLVHLGLLLLGSEPRLEGLFRGALLAHAATWIGTAVQAAWLAALPPGAIDSGTMSRLPGSLAATFPGLEALGPSLLLLFQQVTVFDLGWIVLFALAIEDRDSIRAAPALIAVSSVWAFGALARWSLYLYLTGMA